MPLFPKFMALLWTFAELLFVVFIHQGVREAVHNRSWNVWYLLGYGILFVMLTLLLFWGELAVSRWVNFSHVIYLRFYNLALWNFFCTIWVMLEGIIMLYVIYIYSHLNPYAKYKTKPIHLNIQIAVLVILCLACYGLFEYSVFQVTVKHQLNEVMLRRISIIYVRFCGIFWIIFEAAVAIYGILIYQRLCERTLNNPDKFPEKPIKNYAV